MSSVAQANSDKGGEGPQNSFLLLSSAEMLGSKVNTVLRIIKEVQALARIPTEEGKGWEDDDGRDVSPEYDEEVRDSAESTLIRALGRLDSIIDADENWDVSVADKVLDKRVEELHRVNMEAAKERLELIKNQNRASYRLRSKLFRDGNDFLAVAGDDPWDEHAIVGRGRTPEEALDNLDAILTSKYKSSDETT